MKEQIIGGAWADHMVKFWVDAGWDDTGEFSVDGVNDKTEQQIRDIANLPFVHHHVAIMPDAHQGWGMPIGGVLPLKDAIIPHAVGVDIACFSGDTQVSLVDGSKEDIKTLYESGKGFWVYSINNEQDIVPGRAVALKTKKDAELVEVTISGGETIKCTPDQRFMLRNGSYKAAKELDRGDSLMPLYRKYGARDGYEMFDNPGEQMNTVRTHEAFANHIYGRVPDDYEIHHLNKDRRDNRPENLGLVSAKDHRKIHANTKENIERLQSEEFKEKRLATLRENGFYDDKYEEKKRRVSRENICNWMEENPEKFEEVVSQNANRGSAFFKEKNSDPEMQARQRLGKIRKCAKRCLESDGDVNAKNFNEYREQFYNYPYYEEAKSFIQKQGFDSFDEIIDKENWDQVANNHKVAAVNELDVREDVYDLKVEKHHNFALGAGVFVHNCGMNFVPLKVDSMERAKDVLHKGTPNGKLGKAILSDVKRNIHVGVGGNWNKCQYPEEKEKLLSKSVDIFGDRTFEMQPSERNHLFDEVAPKALGTLGSGNHFCEIQRDVATGDIGLMVHTGSRKFGYDIAEFYHDYAKEKNDKWNSDIPNLDLAFLPAHSDIGQEYFEFSKVADEFAILNRKIIMDEFITSAKKVLERFGINDYSFGDRINCHHNFVDLEHHYGEDVYVHRKGAIRAREGDMGIIPGAMGANSYIVEGKGSDASFHSASHGAGRTMGRNEAKREFSVQDMMEEFNERDMFLIADNKKSALDEYRKAYKDVHDVMDNQEDLVDIKRKLLTVGVLKG